MDNIREYIDNTIDIISDMSELFYQQKTNEALNSMNILLDNIMNIGAYIDNNADMSLEDKNKIVVILSETLNSMEMKDYILLADILKYDMSEVLREYKDRLL